MSHLRHPRALHPALRARSPCSCLTAVPAAAQDDDEDEREPPITWLSSILTNGMRETPTTRTTTCGSRDRPLAGARPVTARWPLRPTTRRRTDTTRWLGRRLIAVAHSACRSASSALPQWRATPRLNRTAVTPPNSRGDDDSRPMATTTDNSLLSSSRPDGETTLSIRRKPDGCASGPIARTSCSREQYRGQRCPDSADAELLALARRAAALAEFKVRVEPDPSPGAVHPSGCDRSTEFTVRGDGERVGGGAARSHRVVPTTRVSIVDTPAPFESFEGSTCLVRRGAGLNIHCRRQRRLVRLEPGAHRHHPGRPRIEQSRCRRVHHHPLLR